MRFIVINKSVEFRIQTIRHMQLLQFVKSITFNVVSEVRGGSKAVYMCVRACVRTARMCVRGSV